MNDSGFTEKKRHPYGVFGLAAVNIGYFLFLAAVRAEGDTSAMIEWGALYMNAGEYVGGWYRLLTSMFMHFDIYHLGSNLLMLMAVGDVLEQRLGTLRVLVVYFAGGLAGNVATVFWCRFLKKSVVSAGASGAVFALVGILCFMALERRGQIPEIRRERVLFMIFIMLYSGMANAEINMAAHIGGILCGLLCGFLVP